jgi:hypothetical protein
MNGRERMMVAIGGQQGTPPVVIPYLQYYFPEVVEHLTSYSRETFVSRGSTEMKADAWTQLHTYFDCDWVRVTVDPSRIAGQDGETADFAALDALPVEEIVARGCFDLSRELIKRFRAEKFVYGRVQVPYGALFGSWQDIGEALIMLKLDPDRAKRLIDDSLPRRLEEVQAWKEVGVDGLWLGQWMCSADLISEAHYLQFIYEADRALVEAVKDAGLIPIYHFCGDVHPRLKHLRNLKPVMFGVEEPKKGFDIQVSRVREEMGPDVCLLGNVDAYGVVERGTPEAWAAEVERQITGGGPRHFVVSIGSPITHDTPPEQLRDFIQTARGVCERYA